MVRRVDAKLGDNEVAAVKLALHRHRDPAEMSVLAVAVRVDAAVDEVGDAMPGRGRALACAVLQEERGVSRCADVKSRMGFSPEWRQSQIP